MTTLEKKQCIRKKRDKTIIGANIEYEGMMWLANHKVPIKLNNIIYNQHNDTFIFGCNKLINEHIIDELVTSLLGFPFTVSIKVGYTLKSK
jgi:hypothetical protein